MKLPNTLSTESKIFWALCFLQLSLWTLIPTLVRHVLPIDANEGYVWGQHFQWGYDRNPWMNALVTHWAVFLGGKSGWLVYGFSQVLVCTAYWSTWQLGRRLLNPTYAIIAVLMLIGMQYYSIAAVDLNDNLLDLGLWPLMVYLGWRAFETRQLKFWLLSGVVAGLAMMSKYYSIVPVICLFSFFVINQTARSCFKQLGIYLCTGIAFLICLPHLLWLPSHDWITITYAQHKVHLLKHHGWLNHVLNPLYFAGAQIGTFCGALFLYLMLTFKLPGRNNKTTNQVRSKSQKCANAETNHDTQKTWFLSINTLGPFLITLLLSVIFGWQLNTLWGMGLLSLWPLLLLSLLKPTFTCKRLKIYICACFVVFFLLLAGYTIGKTKHGSHSSANVPGKAFSVYINQLWQKRFHTQLQYTAGNRYLGGYVAYFARHPISVYIDWNSVLCGWINQTQFKEKGAVFLQFARNGKHFPSAILKAYPKLETIGVKHFVYHRAKNGHPTLNVLIGLLPPNQ